MEKNGANVAVFSACGLLSAFALLSYKGDTLTSFNLPNSPLRALLPNTVATTYMCLLSI